MSARELHYAPAGLTAEGERPKAVCGAEVGLVRRFTTELSTFTSKHYGPPCEKCKAELAKGAW